MLGSGARPKGSPAGFNPRPANWPGDASQRLQGPGRMFQSAPGQLAGRCCDHGGSALSRLVSIRARPIGRAMRRAGPRSPRTSREFQSAPGQLAGRCLTASSRRMPVKVSIRARPIGRAMPRERSRCRSLVVSIRARPIGRAMPPTPARHAAPFDVSIRARPIGRAMPCPVGDPPERACVSIRARPIGRAMPACADADQRGIEFQSAPGQLAGRCDRIAHAAEPGRRCFNPRPANWPGDAAARRPAHGRRHVSIRARPIGRAMRRPVDRCVTRRSMFQSAPGQLAGRCRRLEWRVASREVSIRARPIGRAMPGRRAPRWLPVACFNPRPANWPGDARCVGNAAMMIIGFNPRPANWPGDAWPAETSPLAMPGFNPRPANWPGDAVTGRGGRDARMFQSAPGQLAGRCHRAAGSIMPQPICFNPRPANWPGDALLPVDAVLARDSFNPRPANWPGDAPIR